jgi:hypothetical protein
MLDVILLVASQLLLIVIGIKICIFDWRVICITKFDADVGVEVFSSGWNVK